MFLKLKLAKIVRTRWLWYFRANQIANSLEKKQKGFDKVIDEWKRKCEALVAEVEQSQRETRAAATETFRLRNQLEESHEQTEAVKRENRALAQELKDITDQLGEGGKSVHDLQKLRRKLEIEKEELQQALDDAEAALEGEEAKVLRAQVEVSQIRSEIEKRLQEKVVLLFGQISTMKIRKKNSNPPGRITLGLLNRCRLLSRTRPEEKLSCSGWRRSWRVTLMYGEIRDSKNHTQFRSSKLLWTTPTKPTWSPRGIWNDTRKLLENSKCRLRTKPDTVTRPESTLQPLKDELKLCNRRRKTWRLDSSRHDFFLSDFLVSPISFRPNDLENRPSCWLLSTRKPSMNWSLRTWDWPRSRESWSPNFR